MSSPRTGYTNDDGRRITRDAPDAEMYRDVLTQIRAYSPGEERPHLALVIGSICLPFVGFFVGLVLGVWTYTSDRSQAEFVGFGTWFGFCALGALAAWIALNRTGRLGPLIAAVFGLVLNAAPLLVWLVNDSLSSSGELLYDATFIKVGCLTFAGLAPALLVGGRFFLRGQNALGVKLFAAALMFESALAALPLGWTYYSLALCLLLAGLGQFLAALRNTRAYPVALACWAGSAMMCAVGSWNVFANDYSYLWHYFNMFAIWPAAVLAGASLVIAAVVPRSQV